MRGRMPHRTGRFTRRATRPILGLPILAALALPAPAASQAPTGAPSQAAVAEFDAYVAEAVRDWRVPGLAIALVHGDSVLFARGYGVREVGKPARVDEHTRFAVGSTTKAMTTAALAMLVDEGKLDWDDRVIDHLPGFRLYDPYVTRELTIRDLLTHRTGLPSTDLYWSVLRYDMDEMMRRLRHVEPVSSFRSQWLYQNVVYAIAGALVEEASGMSWDAFVRERLFEPLGMHETEPLDAGILSKPNVAVPHDLEGDSLFTVPKRSVDNVASVGSVWSSVSDMSKWLRFMLDSARVDGRALIEPETYREIVTPEIRAPLSIYPALQLSKPHVITYALGWFVHDYQGDVVWMHTGSINGMSAIVGLLPDHRFGVVVLVNRDHAELRHALMYRAFDLAAGHPDRDWSGEVMALFERRSRRDTGPAPAPTPPSLPLDRYVGTYADPAYGEVRVTRTGDGLQAAINDAPPRSLEHQTFERFRTVEDTASLRDFTLTFVPDGAGGIAAVRLFGVTLERVDDGG